MDAAATPIGERTPLTLNVVLTLIGFGITALGGAVGYGALRSDVSNQAIQITDLRDSDRKRTDSIGDIKEQLATVKADTNSLKATAERIERKLDRRSP